MPNVSIIVPVYNAEKTLCRCVDSIINQEYTDFELLLVDDGSTDSSGLICDGYAMRDARVRVIHKENSGVSDTRNLGLSEAAGTYLQFVDSDDWISADATKRFVQAAEEYDCDLVISDFYRVIGERLSQKGNIDALTAFSTEEYATYMMENPADFYYGVLWNKLFRRELIEKYKLRMDPSVSWCEDFMFNLEYIRHAKVFYAIQIPLYYYVKTKGSLVSQGMSLSKTVKMKKAVFSYYNNFYKKVFSEEDYEKIRPQVYRFLIDGASDGTLTRKAKKLGKEGLYISPEELAAPGSAPELYRYNKLLDYYLEPVALRYDLSIKDVHLLLCFHDPDAFFSKQDLADRIHETVSVVSQSLQRLATKGLLKAEEVSADKYFSGQKKMKLLQITFLPDMDPVLADLAQAQADYDEARFCDFTPQERDAYQILSQKMEHSTRRILSNYQIRLQN